LKQSRHLDNHPDEFSATAGNPEPVLETVGLSKDFGGIRALIRIDLRVDREHIVSLIGPNGAGKTTFINVITGIYAPEEGSVRFNGKDITGLPAHEIAYHGVARTFQLGELFPSLSVLENAMMGCYTKSRAGILATGLRLPSARTEKRRIMEQALANLRLVGIEHRAREEVTSLPLGERKLLGIARALGLEPGLLFLDEPAAGLASHEIERLSELIHSLADTGIRLLIVEHNMPFVMGISERVTVLEEGMKIAEGLPEEIRYNEDVIKAYLGEEN
jgi:ABC-type branched-subunit amino acid transport system ATPase component